MTEPDRPSSQFRITRVLLRHFRSIAACDVELGRMALLVGANGSGKSNFLDGLRLVSDSLQTTLDHALRDRGGIGEVRRRATGHPTHFGIRLEFVHQSGSGTYGFQVAAVKGKDFRISDEICEVHFSDSTSRPDDLLWPRSSSFKVRNGQVVEGPKVALPPATSDRLFLVAASALPEFRSVYDGLADVNVYNINPESMRQLQTPDAGTSLRRDGSNIASVLERLRRENPNVKTRVEEYLRQIVPGVRGVERIGLGSYETIKVDQQVAGAKSPWSFLATSVSDGTLRALGVLTALFAGSAQRLSPIGIEEPESALHPAAARLLLDALRDASSRRQVLVTSHSPDLLDNETISESEILAVTAKDGQTTIGRLDATARSALEDSLFTPGELLRVGQLQPQPSVEQIDLFR
ncbi:AAA family ATPase [Nakamurella sp.]|uniref:AAA family ATPase n=1 Tax=Nakamurella sp. TaxID=1869182 RepID=UPI003B3BCDF0